MKTMDAGGSRHAPPEAAPDAPSAGPDVPPGGMASAGQIATEFVYTVSVRELCAFAARAGDLDLRFTPSPTAEQGMAGHRVVAARRGEHWRAEVPLDWTYRTLRVRGRADGVDLRAGVLEEIKTHRGDAGRIPPNRQAMHRAQARAYGAMLCRAHGLPRLELRLVYFDIDRQAETVLAEEHDAPALSAFLDDLCERFVGWADAQRAHRARRDEALARLAWPHDGWRAGQRDLARAVYNAARAGRTLLAQAPTGIGKTMATLFPMLKALPGQRLDKLLFLTARNPGRQLALDALALLEERAAASDAETRNPSEGSDRPGMDEPPGEPPGGPASPAARAAPPLRVLTLIARDHACERPGRACHPDDCDLARGFWDRLPAARQAATRATTPAALRDTALAHDVCPYWLAQEMARWADVVVADYNHWFDAGALLHALAEENDWRVALLVDEAHNLVPRARDMYTAALDPARLRAARHGAPAALIRPLERLRRAWKAVDEGGTRPFQVLDAVPRRLLDALKDLAVSIAERSAQDPSAVRGELLELHFDALRFLSMTERLDAHGQFDLTRRPRAGDASRTETVPCVRNLVPAPHVAPRLARAHAAVLFSATLAPPAYPARMLGLPKDTVSVDIASPFDAGHLEVRVARDISTRHADRAASLPRVVALIRDAWRARPGNHLAFFGSFDYMEQAAKALATDAPDIPLRLQRRGMSGVERQDFIDSFVPGGAQLGFAVLGGAFAEGIDLPGTRLVGVFVATLGLPQVNPVNESLRRRLDTLFGDGFAHAYLYPGLQKVVQAAGRVIRTPEDRGTVHLIDDRFARADVAALLPAWWRVGER